MLENPRFFGLVLVMFALLLAAQMYAQTTTAISLPRNETLYVGGNMWYTPTNWNPLAQLWGSGAAYPVFGLVYWPLFFWDPYKGILLPALGRWYGFQYATYSAYVPISVSVSGSTATITVNATNIQTYTTTLDLSQVPYVSWPSYIYFGNIVGGEPMFLGITYRGKVTVTVVNITAVVGSSTQKTIQISSAYPVFFNVTVVYPTTLSVSNQYTLLGYYAPGDVFNITVLPQTTTPVFTAPYNVVGSKFIVMNLTGVTTTTLPLNITMQRTFVVVSLWPGEYWQDGQPITSRDIAFTLYLQLQHPELGDSWIWGPSTSGNLIRVVPYNDTVAIFEINGTASGEAWYNTILHYLPILPEHIWYNVSSPLTWQNPNPVGSGPYEGLFYDDIRAVFMRWDNWWGWKVFGINPNNVPKYFVDMYVTSNALVMTFIQQHGLDWNSFFVPNVQNYQKTYLSSPPYFLQYPDVDLAIANYTYPWNMCAVRRALWMVINATPLSQVAEFGYEPVCLDPLCLTGTVFQDSWGRFINWTAVNQYLQEYYGVSWNPNTGSPYNPSGAAQLLQSLGFYKGSDGYWHAPNGTVLSLTIMVPYGWTDYMQAAQMLADQLEKFGIKATASYPQYSALVTQMQQGTFSATFEVLGPWTGFTPYPWFQEWMFPTGPGGTTVPIGTATWANWGRWYMSNAYPTFLQISMTPLTDYQTMQKYYSVLIQDFLSCPPFIPLYRHAYWYAYDDTYWVGWPNQNNPAPVLPASWNPPDNVLIVLHLKPRVSAPSVTTVTTATTYTTTTVTTVVSGTTYTTVSTVPVVSTVTSVVSAVPTWVWGVVALLIIVIIVVAVLALRRR
ncbi:MAG: ABC transporter substrate-binding protein [Thermoproteus sp.]